MALFLFADRNDVVPGKCLRILLGVIGVGLLVATAAVFLPVEWMAAIHRWLGLGEFPDSPITIYLARIDVTAVRRSWILDAIHGHSPSPVSVIGEDFWMPAHCYRPDDARHRLDHTDATLLDRS